MPQNNITPNVKKISEIQASNRKPIDIIIESRRTKDIKNPISELPDKKNAVDMPGFPSQCFQAG